MNDVQNYLYKVRMTYLAHYENFQQIFKVPLSKFWDQITGFDIVKFDEEVIKPPEGVSTKQLIEEKYGNGAVELCNKLIHNVH